MYQGFNLYKTLIIVPIALVSVLVLGGFFYRSVVRVDPRIVKAVQDQDLALLKSLSQDAALNWYQSSMALEHYAGLACDSGDLYLQSILNSSNISLRRAIYTGCYTRSFKEVAWMIERGLQDGYSYNRYQSLDYLGRTGEGSSYRKTIEKRVSDSSSMVRIRATDLLAAISKDRLSSQGN